MPAGLSAARTYYYLFIQSIEHICVLLISMPADLSAARSYYYLFIQSIEHLLCVADINASRVERCQVLLLPFHTEHWTPLVCCWYQCQQGWALPGLIITFSYRALNTSCVLLISIPAGLGATRSYYYLFIQSTEHLLCVADINAIRVERCQVLLLPFHREHWTHLVCCWYQCQQGWALPGLIITFSYRALNTFCVLLISIPVGLSATRSYYYLFIQSIEHLLCVADINSNRLGATRSNYNLFLQSIARLLCVTDINTSSIELLLCVADIKASRVWRYQVWSLPFHKEHWTPLVCCWYQYQQGWPLSGLITFSYRALNIFCVLLISVTTELSAARSYYYLFIQSIEHLLCVTDINSTRVGRCQVLLLPFHTEHWTPLVCCWYQCQQGWAMPGLIITFSYRALNTSCVLLISIAPGLGATRSYYYLFIHIIEHLLCVADINTSRVERWQVLLLPLHTEYWTPLVCCWYQCH